MKKYVVYDWRADDEGGTDIYLASEWSPLVGYHPESGWRARLSVKVGEFDTVQELARILADRDEHMKSEYEKRARENTNPFVVFAECPLPRYEFNEWLSVATEMFRDYEEDMI